MGYVLSLAGVSTVIIGCSSTAEVDENADAARLFQPFDELGNARHRRKDSRALRLLHFL